MSYTFRAIVGSEQYELPDWTQSSLGFDFSDVGVFSGEYAKDGLNSGRVVDGAVIVALWNGSEKFDSRFILSAGDDDDDVETVTKKVTGLSVLDVFRRVVVEELAAKPGQSLTFTNSTPGGILIALFTPAQARGAMTGITWDFTNTVDSAGQPWAKVIPNIEYKLGLKYLDLIRNLVDQGVIELRFDGTKLQAFNADAMGSDLSASVELRAGLDYEEMPRKWSSADRAKFSMAIGDNGVIVRRTDASVPDGPFGREEMAISQGGTSDTGTLTLVNDAALDKVKQTREQLTRKVIIREDGPIPSVDYRVSDYISERIVEEDGVSRSTSYRLRSMVIELDGSGDIGRASITLNDKFLESQIRMARKVTGIIGGATSDGGGNGVPVEEKPDRTTPSAPTALNLSSTAYLDANGQTRSLVSATWSAPTTNTDGTALTDLKEYQFQWQYVGDAANQWRTIFTTDPWTTFSNLDPERDIQAQVRAWDNTKHGSSWTPVDTVTTANDTIAPPVPSTPTAEVYLGAVLLHWDGKGVGGELMPSDYAGCRVHFSTVDDFDPDATNVSQTMLFKNRPGTIPVSGLEYGVTYFFKLVAFDHNGNASSASGQVSAVPRRVVETDIEPGAISTGVVNFNARDLGAQETFYGPSAPSSPNQDDFWVDTSSNNQLKRWDGAAWIDVSDDRIVTALNNAEQAATDAQTAYDKAIAQANVFYQTSAPTGLTADNTNDLWIDTDDNQKVYRWSGSAWEATKLASTDYILSRGTDLVTNGTGYLGSNYNFSWATFNKADAPEGAAGSFVTALGDNGAKFSDELIPYDPSKKYVLRYKAKQLAVGHADARIYDGLAPYDNGGNSITPNFYMYLANTLTTLSADLKPGDTVVHLTSAAGWANDASTSNKHAIFWDYTDAAGKLWPELSYSRNVMPYQSWVAGAVDFVNNTITLTNPWAGPLKPAGTKLSNGSSGGTYIYGNSQLAVPEVWTAFSTPTVTGLSKNGANASFSAGLPPGTAAVKLMYLPNRLLGSPYDDNGSQHAFAAISFSDVNAAQTTADGKNTIFSQTSAPSTAGRINGDMWYDTDDGLQLYIFTNGAWQVSDLGTQAINFTARDIGAITTYWQTTAPTGTLKIGDLWIDTDDKNKTYRWSGTQWDLAADQRIAEAITAAAGAQATADGKVKTFTGPTAPTAEGDGDLWVDTDDNNKLYRWDATGAAWVAVDDARIAAQAAQIAQLQTDLSNANAAIATTRSIADGLVVTYYQTSPPAGAAEGDVWVDTDDSNKSYRLSTSLTWDLITDTRVTDALNNAAAASASADGKITSYWQASQPAGMTDSNAGDMWFDTDDGNKAYWYRSSSPGPAGWVAIPFGGNAIAAGSIGQVNLVTEIRSALGQIFYDDFSDVSRWDVISGAQANFTSVSVADAKTGGTVGQSVGYVIRTHKTLIPFDPNELYRVTVRVRDNSGTAGKFSAGVMGVAADGSSWVNAAGANSTGSQFTMAPNNADPGGAWTDYVGYFQGTAAAPTIANAPDPKAPAKLHDNVRFVRPTIVMNYSGGVGDIMQIDMMKVEAVPVGLVARANIALAAINSALIEDAAIINAKIANLAVTDAKINDLAANKITTAELAAGVRVIAGPETSAHAEVTATGFYAYADDPDGGSPNLAVRMGTVDNDLFSVTNTAGDAVATISDVGDGSFQKLYSLQDPEFMGTQLLGAFANFDSPTEQNDANPGLLDKLPRGIVAHGAVQGGSTFTSRIIIRDLSFEAQGGRTYRICFSGCHTTFNAANKSGGYAIVMTQPSTIGGTAPAPQFTNYETVLFSQAITPVSGQTITTPSGQKAYRCNPGGQSIGGELTPGTIRLGLVILGDLCSITPSSADWLYWWVEDIGPDIPSTAVTNNSTLGGTQNAPASVKTYTKTYASTSAATYKGTGAKRTDTTDVVQGYNSYNGDGEGLWIFPSMTSDLSGATVKKVEVYAYANHWYYNSGGTALIKVHGYTSAPASSPSMTTAVSSASWPKPGGRWVTLPSSLWAGFKSGTYRGFGMGPSGGTNLLYYGRFNGGTAARIRVTYTK